MSSWYLLLVLISLMLSAAASPFMLPICLRISLRTVSTPWAILILPEQNIWRHWLCLKVKTYRRHRCSLLSWSKGHKSSLRLLPKYFVHIDEDGWVPERRHRASQSPDFLLQCCWIGCDKTPWTGDFLNPCWPGQSPASTGSWSSSCSQSRGQSCQYCDPPGAGGISASRILWREQCRSQQQSWSLARPGQEADGTHCPHLDWRCGRGWWWAGWQCPAYPWPHPPSPCQWRWCT